MIDVVDLGKRIRTIRISRGISKDALASAIGLKRDTLTEIESGKNPPSTATFVRIANVLEVNARDLLCNYVDADKAVVMNELSDYLDALAPQERNFVTPLIDYLATSFRKMKQEKG